MNIMNSELHIAILHVWAAIALIFIVIECELWAIPENEGENDL